MFKLRVLLPDEFYVIYHLSKPLQTGERFGLIRFGSRTDVVFPKKQPPS